MPWTTEHLPRLHREETLEAHRDGVERSIQLIYDHIGNALTIDELADAAIMSRFHFTRVFSQLTSVSPGRFLAAVRMQKAKHLLLKTELSITDIAFEVGYSSLGTFSRMFSHFVGFPPVHFRQLSLAVLSMAVADVARFLPHHQPTATTSTISGDIVCDRSLALVTVALFPTAIPRSHPIECICLTETRRFALTSHAPIGARLFVAGLLDTATMEQAILLSHEQVRVGIAIPSAHGELTVELGTWSRTNPPVVVAFPLLLLEKCLHIDLSTFGEANLDS